MRDEGYLQLPETVSLSVKKLYFHDKNDSTDHNWEQEREDEVDYYKKYMVSQVRLFTLH